MPKLSKEEWEKLSKEEQESRQDEKPDASPDPEVKEDVVIIDGKPRPLKNFVAEISRKVKEDVTAEVLAAQPKKEPVKPIGNNDDFLKQVTAAAEKEMEETGSMIPVNTLLNLINQGTGYHIKSVKTANKLIKATRRELKKDHKDFGDYSDEFDDIVDDIEPQNISKDGLKIIFNSLRGKKAGSSEEEIAKRVEEGIKKGLEGHKIIGNIDTNVNSNSKTVDTGKLTPAQEQEMKDMAFEKAEDYLGRLKKFQAIAKAKNAKNTPILLSERLIF